MKRRKDGIDPLIISFSAHCTLAILSKVQEMRNHVKKKDWKEVSKNFTPSSKVGFLGPFGKTIQAGYHDVLNDIMLRREEGMFLFLIVLLIIRTLHGHCVAAIIQYPSEFEVQTQHELTEHL